MRTNIPNICSFCAKDVASVRGEYTYGTVELNATADACADCAKEVHMENTRPCPRNAVVDVLRSIRLTTPGSTNKTIVIQTYQGIVLLVVDIRILEDQVVPDEKRDTEYLGVSTLSIRQTLLNFAMLGIRDCVFLETIAFVAGVEYWGYGT